MNPFKNKYEKKSQRPVSANTKQALGSLTMSAEHDVTKNDVNWDAVAALSTPVPKSERGSQGKRVWLNNSEIASAKTADGHTQRLMGIMFAGSEKFGLVAHSSSDGVAPDRFYLTAIGENQEAAHPLRYVDFNQISQVRPEGYVKNWEDITIGRDPANNVVSSNADVSGNHARITVAQTDVELVDRNSTNGTTVLTAELFNGQNIDPQLVDAWNYLQASPDSWSGTQGAQNAVAL